MKQQKIVKPETRKNTVMKTIPLLLALIILINPVHAIIGINEFPVTEVNMEYVESIDSSGYGFEGANVTCSAFNFEIPSRQASNPTYISLGYTPLCDVNYTDYEQYLTLFCRGEYIWSSNYTEQCGLPAEESIFGSDLFIQINHANYTSFTTGSGKLISCQMCVNASSTAPQTDFFVNIRNTGSRIDVVEEVTNIIPELEIVVNGINTIIAFIIAFVSLALTTLSELGFIWLLFVGFLAVLYFLNRIRKKVVDFYKGRD